MYVCGVVASSHKTVWPIVVVFCSRLTPSRTQAKLRGISEQLEPQRCSVHDPLAYGHALALTNTVPALGR